MNVRFRLAALFLVSLGACQGAAPQVDAPVASGSKAAGQPAASAQKAPKATTRPVVAAVPELARRARALADRERALEAVELTLRELVERCDAAQWQDETLVADSCVAALMLEGLLMQTNAWAKALEVLPAETGATTPAELASQLGLVRARALIRTGDVAAAASIISGQGTLRDWRVIGPFANERGGGFDAVYAPEEKLDLAQVVRGKERDVAWRSNPCPEQPLGLVLLDELLRPKDQAVAYLATAVKVETPRAVCLWVGSSGELKVWHGQRLALARKVQRLYHRDQDRVVLELVPGWNPILLKVGQEEGGSWLASARLTELDGRPLAAATLDSSFAGTTIDSKESAAQSARSARELLEARGEDARALALLAEWHMLASPDDYKAHTQKGLAERALALSPEDTDLVYLVARANEPNPRENSAEIRHNERLMPLKDVLRREPGHVGAMLDLVEFWRTLNPLQRSAQEMAERALAAAPQSLRALRLRAQTLEEFGRNAEAAQLRELARATPEGRLALQEQVGVAYQLFRRGKVAEAYAVFDGLIATNAERPVFESAIGLALERGEIARAVALTEAALARSPFDVARLLDTAEALERVGQLGEARGYLRRALVVCPEEARIHKLLARVCDREGDVAGAERAREDVARLDPGYDLARRQRALLATDEQKTDSFEGPWRWDALTRVGSVPTSTTNDSVQVVDRTTVWRVEPDGTEHEYEHIALQVENTAGVKALDNYWISYPSDGSLQVYNVRVIHADGSFERAPAPRGGDQGWGGDYVRGFDLPPLVPGDLVDIEYRVDQTQPDVFGQYFGLRHTFQVDNPDALAPVHRAELVVLAPKDVQLYSKEQNGAALESSIEERDGVVVRRWVARDLKRPASEAAMPDRREFMPLVDISTFASWQAFAGWWWGFIEKEFVTTPAMKEKVAELTKGLTTEADKVRAIAQFVGQEIRYNAWSFGTHGYQPFSAATIFERRFGDCKDKSILLRQLLAEIGVESHPVLINAAYRRHDEKLDIAMVGHFNHCIAFLPATAERAGYYLDATADRNPVEYLRADDQGAKVLHVRDGKGEIVQIPYTAPEQNEFVRRYDVQLARDGSGEIRVLDDSSGMFGVQNRYQFGGEQGDLKQRLSRAFAEAFGKVDVLDVATSKLEDIGAAAHVEARLKAENLWTREALGAALRTSFDPIPILEVAAEAAESRQFEVVLDRPFRMRTTVLYRLPEGTKVKDLPADETVSLAGLVDYTMHARTTPEGVEVERVFTLRERRIPRERYADLRAALDEIRAAEARQVVLSDTQSNESKPKENK
jgi:transglutaminase-like putative cysteine protease/Tfp pilus assembly protein PilF